MLKNCLLVMCLCCFTAILSAQYRLDSVYNSFRAGDHLVKKQVEYKDPGSNGRELTWDFSFLKSLNEECTLDYFIPDSARMDTLCGMEHRTRYYTQVGKDSLQMKIDTYAWYAQASGIPYSKASGQILLREKAKVKAEQVSTPQKLGAGYHNSISKRCQTIFQNRL